MAWLRAADFVHPEDAAALQNLHAIPLFPQVVGKFMELWSDRQQHALNMAQKVRLSPKQLPDIYRLLPPICDAMGIEEPEFYMQQAGDLNAYTSGAEIIQITLHSGLVEALDRDELVAVLAHECGHIAAKHVLYKTMAEMLFSTGASFLGPVAALATPIRLAIQAWSRRSELTCDRAAVAYTGDPDATRRVLLRLGAGPRSLTDAMDIDEYVLQAREYDLLTESTWDNLLVLMATHQYSHPLLVVRVREAANWAAGEQYQRLYKSGRDWRALARCPSCGMVAASGAKFCGRCATPLGDTDAGRTATRQPAAAGAAVMSGAASAGAVSEG